MKSKVWMQLRMGCLTLDVLSGNHDVMEYGSSRTVHDDGSESIGHDDGYGYADEPVLRLIPVNGPLHPPLATSST